MGVVPVVAAPVTLETEVGADARIEEIDSGPGRQFPVPSRVGAIEQAVAATAVLAPKNFLARPLAVADESSRWVGGVLRLPGCPGRTTPTAGGKEQDHHGNGDGAPRRRRSISRPAHGRSAGPRSTSLPARAPENACAGAPGFETQGPRTMPRPERESRAGRRCCRPAP